MDEQKKIAKVPIRFWAKVEKSDGCWMWKASKDRHGRGVFRMGNGKGVLVISSRVAWMLERGPIPDGLCVLHRCDVGGCVNPDHLFLGTMRDNTQDMMAKGRHRCGRKVPAAAVPLIRLLSDCGVKAKRLAALYGVDHKTIRNIARRIAGARIPDLEGVPS